MQASKLKAMVIVLALGFIALAGCSSSSSDSAAPSSDSGSSTTGGSSDSSGSTGADTATPGSADTGGSDSSGAGRSPAGGVKLADGEAPAERTISLDGDAFSPNSLDVKVGDDVTFKATDGKVHAVIVGDLDGATLSGGLIETFAFSKAGSYSVTDELGDATITITVS